MAFMTREIIDLKGILLLMLLIVPLIATTNIDCNGKAFRCVNSTHFMICVDLGTGISTTIDDFVMRCPLTTVCRPTNRFECEFPTPKPVIKVSSTTISTVPTEAINDDIATISLEVATSAPFDEYLNTYSISTISELELSPSTTEKENVENELKLNTEIVDNVATTLPDVNNDVMTASTNPVDIIYDLRDKLFVIPYEATTANNNQAFATTMVLSEVEITDTNILSDSTDMIRNVASTINSLATTEQTVVEGLFTDVFSKNFENATMLVDSSITSNLSIDSTTEVNDVTIVSPSDIDIRHSKDTEQNLEAIGDTATTVISDSNTNVLYETTTAITTRDSADFTINKFETTETHKLNTEGNSWPTVANIMSTEMATTKRDSVLNHGTSSEDLSILEYNISILKPVTTDSPNKEATSIDNAFKIETEVIFDDNTVSLKDANVILETTTLTASSVGQPNDLASNNIRNTSNDALTFINEADHISTLDSVITDSPNKETTSIDNAFKIETEVMVHNTVSLKDADVILETTILTTSSVGQPNDLASNNIRNTSNDALTFINEADHISTLDSVITDSPNKETTSIDNAFKIETEVMVDNTVSLKDADVILETTTLTASSVGQPNDLASNNILNTSNDALTFINEADRIYTSDSVNTDSPNKATTSIDNAFKKETEVMVDNTVSLKDADVILETTALTTSSVGQANDLASNHILNTSNDALTFINKADHISTLDSVITDSPNKETTSIDNAFKIKTEVMVDNTVSLKDADVILETTTLTASSVGQPNDLASNNILNTSNDALTFINEADRISTSDSVNTDSSNKATTSIDNAFKIETEVMVDNTVSLKDADVILETTTLTTSSVGQANDLASNHILNTSNDALTFINEADHISTLDLVITDSPNKVTTSIDNAFKIETEVMVDNTGSSEDANIIFETITLTPSSQLNDLATNHIRNTSNDADYKESSNSNDKFEANASKSLALNKDDHFIQTVSSPYVEITTETLLSEKYPIKPATVPDIFLTNVNTDFTESVEDVAMTDSQIILVSNPTSDFPNIGINDIGETTTIYETSSITEDNYYEQFNIDIIKNPDPGNTEAGTTEELFTTEGLNYSHNVSTEVTSTVETNFQLAKEISGNVLPIIINLNSTSIKDFELTTESGVSIPSIDIDNYVNNSSKIVNNTTNSAELNEKVSWMNGLNNEDEMQTHAYIQSVQTSTIDDFEVSTKAAHIGKDNIETLTVVPTISLTDTIVSTTTDSNIIDSIDQELLRGENISESKNLELPPSKDTNADNIIVNFSSKLSSESGIHMDSDKRLTNVPSTISENISPESLITVNFTDNNNMLSYNRITRVPNVVTTETNNILSTNDIQSNFNVTKNQTGILSTNVNLPYTTFDNGSSDEEGENHSKTQKDYSTNDEISTQSTLTHRSTPSDTFTVTTSDYYSVSPEAKNTMNHESKLDLVKSDIVTENTITQNIWTQEVTTEFSSVILNKDVDDEMVSQSTDITTTELFTNNDITFQTITSSNLPAEQTVQHIDGSFTNNNFHNIQNSQSKGLTSTNGFKYVTIKDPITSDVQFAVVNEEIHDTASLSTTRSSTDKFYNMTVTEVIKDPNLHAEENKINNNFIKSEQNKMFAATTNMETETSFPVNNDHQTSNNNNISENTAPMTSGNFTQKMYIENSANLNLGQSITDRNEMLQNTDFSNNKSQYNSSVENTSTTIHEFLDDKGNSISTRSDFSIDERDVAKSTTDYRSVTISEQVSTTQTQTSGLMEPDKNLMSTLGSIDNTNNTKSAILETQTNVGKTTELTKIMITLQNQQPTENVTLSIGLDDTLKGSSLETPGSSADIVFKKLNNTFDIKQDIQPLPLISEFQIVSTNTNYQMSLTADKDSIATITANKNKCNKTYDITSEGNAEFTGKAISESITDFTTNTVPTIEKQPVIWEGKEKNAQKHNTGSVEKSVGGTSSLLVQVNNFKNIEDAVQSIMTEKSLNFKDTTDVISATDVVIENLTDSKTHSGLISLQTESLVHQRRDHKGSELEELNNSSHTLKERPLSKNNLSPTSKVDDDTANEKQNIKENKEEHMTQVSNDNNDGNLTPLIPQLSKYQVERVPMHELIKNRPTDNSYSSSTSEVQNKYRHSTTDTSNIHSSSYSPQQMNFKSTEHLVLQSTTPKPKINNYDCKQKRGRYADKQDCRKFYICLGNGHVVAGTCPVKTVFSEIRKQCTNNLSHCVRNNQFQCLIEGRFSDYLDDNVYYICVKKNISSFIRFKLQCLNGYHLNKTSVRCALNIESDLSESTSDSSSTTDTSESSSPSIQEMDKSEKKFKCEKEGKFPDTSNPRRYFECRKKNHKYQQRKKKCKSEKIYDRKKKTCVDDDSDLSNQSG